MMGKSCNKSSKWIDSHQVAASERNILLWSSSRLNAQLTTVHIFYQVYRWYTLSTEGHEGRSLQLPPKPSALRVDRRRDRGVDAGG